MLTVGVLGGGSVGSTACPNPVVLTLGYLLSAVVFLPLGFMTLEENVFFQFFAFVVFIALTLLFIGVRLGAAKF